MSVSIKISEENYKMLCNLSGKLRSKFQKTISINDALTYLGQTRLSDLAGSWTLSGDEEKKIKKELKEGWKRWKKSA